MLLTHLTKASEHGAGRIALTSSRSRHEIAADFGIGISTLRHWLNRHRELELDYHSKVRHEDTTTELNRVRRKIGILPGAGDPQPGHSFSSK
jgi:transposase